MMILADLTATFEHNPEKGYYQEMDKSLLLVLGKPVAYKYQDAKNEFCHSGSDTLWVADKLRFGGKPVDFKQKFPHPLSPCIDHIIPVSRGGHP